jgi:cytochrome b561
MQTDSPTYNRVAVALHWAIAGLVVLMFFFGLYADEQKEALRAGEASLEQVVMIYNWHKTVGLLVLALAVTRLAWRLMHKAPPLPATMSGAEVLLTKAVHVAFYVLIIGIPLAGWLIISTSESPSFFFNNQAMQIPEIWGNSEPLHETMEEVHEYGAWTIMILMVLHIAAALKHHFVDRDDVLTRMAPWVKRRG